MRNIDPRNKNATNQTDDNSYDSDEKITNADNPVREGSDESSILHDEAPTSDAEYVKLNEYDNHPREQEEFVDDDKENLKPED